MEGRFSGATVPVAVAAPSSTGGSSKSASTSPAVTKFNGDQLRPYVRKLLESTLCKSEFQKEKLRESGREIAQRIKERMTGLAPSGWKFIVTVTLNQNLGQGGRADMATHWGENDAVVQEIYSNQHILCVCIAYAIQI